MNYLYHQVPLNMEGTTLYPLNVLKERNPSIFEREIAKYEGRELLLRRRIPPLNCLWNDVIFLLSIHPSKFYEVYQKFGYGRIRQSFFEIPEDLLESASTTIYVQDQDGPPKPEYFHPYTRENVFKYSEIPKRTMDHLTTVLGRNDESFFPYVGAPHVCYKGSLDVLGVSVISVGGN